MPSWTLSPSVPFRCPTCGLAWTCTPAGAVPLFPDGPGEAQAPSDGWYGCCTSTQWFNWDVESGKNASNGGAKEEVRT